MKKHEFRLERKGEPLTPEILMRILSQTAGEETAREVYKDLTGKEPPKRGEQDENN